MAQNNPFAGLIAGSVANHSRLNDTLEDIFCFTIDENRSKVKRLLYIPDVVCSTEDNTLNLDTIKHALFERLFISTYTDEIQLPDRDVSSDDRPETTEILVLKYLYATYKNALANTGLIENELSTLQTIIVNNVVTALTTPLIYPKQQLQVQFVDLLFDEEPMETHFFKSVLNAICIDEGRNVCDDLVCHIVKQITERIASYTLVSINQRIYDIVRMFICDEMVALCFMHAQSQDVTTGLDYVNTLLGFLLNLSILAKGAGAETVNHFTSPIDVTSNNAVEAALWFSTNNHTQQLHSIFLGLLTQSVSVRNATLEWLGACLKANSSRRKIWNTSGYMSGLTNIINTTVNDGFMVNLGNVLLRLCAPFTSHRFDKILKVDPTYCLAPDHECASKHLKDIGKETCLLPSTERKYTAAEFNFVTECFFMTHDSLTVGYMVTIDTLIHLNQDVARAEEVYRDIVASGSSNDEDGTSVKNELTKHLQQYLTLKAQLCDPIILNGLFNLMVTTCYWFCQVAVNVDLVESQQTYAPLIERPINFPLPSVIPSTLNCIPEFLVESLVSFFKFIRRFSPKVFEEQGYERMQPILTFIIMYMGSSERILNPHLRAKLAEALEGLMPHDAEEPPQLNTMGSYQRRRLFAEHEFRTQLVPCLMHVFVGIEMTGEDVQFEQKFNYRRPMHLVIDYLWSIEEYQTAFIEKATEAEQNMEAVQAPLFLQFVNMLMNDAVYLLDEALSNMSKLREMQIAIDKGDWKSLPASERTQNEMYMRQVGMTAKFNNVLGRDTIATIEKLTSKISAVFTHSTMVDRVAGMLNYFLDHLVGPKKRNFKVKDQQEYSFDPATTVRSICSVYVHLRHNHAFCLAVSQDGRSYTPQLFTLAENVLVRIGGGALIAELKLVEESVQRLALENKATEETLNDAPEHFFDPIMSTLMMDPVILPSSKQVVDRTTIARHLLSDQSDPFNRMPLSMDQIVSHTELANEIHQWLAERKNKSN